MLQSVLVNYTFLIYPTAAASINMEPVVQFSFVVSR